MKEQSGQSTFLYEKLARRKVLKRSLVGRVLLGIEGAKQRDRDVLYLLALPVDTVTVLMKRIWQLLPARNRHYLDRPYLALTFGLIVAGHLWRGLFWLELLYWAGFGIWLISTFLMFALIWQEESCYR